MLKYQKKTIDNYIEFLEQAHSTIYSQISGNQTSETPELLQLCQECMIKIGEMIEGSEGEDFSGIRDMETYCEYVYVISQNIDIGKVCKEYQKKLIEIFEKVYDKIQKVVVKKEVVFFPYNASMWDCLESIWIAADKDPDCEAYVIPIPYYEKNSQGMAVAEKYEGEKFPPYVPILDYRTYDLAVRQPDIAYIHNPFDQFNNVTSVHPDYYSYELKKNITKVVYVPYFISDNSVFFTHRELPAYYYVDNIVVQSKKMIDSFATTISREKFLSVGNPMVDRIINLNNNKPEIPDSWKSMLANATDLSGKKLVMYNTSLSMIMKERELFLDKMEYVIRIFCEMDEVILVWRPHPLMHVTLQTMGEEFYSRFLKIEKKFLEKKMGVLDTTADVGIAVSLCDAYVGESASSIIHMFGVAGKPRFYIDLKLHKKNSSEDSGKVTFFGTYKEEDNEYFVAEEYRCICKLNAKSEEMQVMAQIPGTKRYHYGAYRDIFKRGDKIYIQPYSGQGLVIYNASEDSFLKMYVRESVPFAFYKMIPDKNSNSLYLLPKEYPYIVRFDLDTEEFEYYKANDAQVQTIVHQLEQVEEDLIGNVYQLSKSVVSVLKAREFLERNNTSTIWENEENFLQDFLYYLRIEDTYKRKNAQQSYRGIVTTLDGTCGEKIHGIIKDSLI